MQWMASRCVGVLIGPQGWGAALGEPLRGGLRVDVGTGGDRREIEGPLPR